ncbi:MAG TPA: DUF6569 family protein [Tepidisphaeraceae bacterium]|nr:DUF6569 family protein [Tepidisphaeraceae bacterium]
MKIIIALVIVVLLCIFAADAAEVAPATRPALGDCKLSGPYSHGNLTVFLIHGPDKLKNREFLTLEEAMAKKLVVVHETSNVNELAIENTGDTDVYVQSGDIVKGGKQDRTIAMDFIVPAKSGKLPIASFCVEHGRWQQRGDESAGYFSFGSTVAGREVKLAAKRSMNQQEVWQEVAATQKKLSDSVGVQVMSGRGGSLQLAQEDKKVKESSEEYTKALAGVIDGKNDVIGYAFAINGKVNSADIYANSGLFKKLWPKLIKASATEATSEKKEGKFALASADDVYGCISNAEKAKPTTQPSGPRAAVVTKDGSEAILFETRDKQGGDDYLHRNYINKK